MDRGQLIYDVVRAYIVSLVLTLSFIVVAVAFAETLDFVSILIIWYQLTGLGILLAVTYRSFNQSELNSTMVGILFFLWTAFLESIFLLHSITGRLSTAKQQTATGYSLALLNNIVLLFETLLILTISGALFVIAIALLRIVYSAVTSPAAKTVFYPVIFGIIIADIVGIALLAPPAPDTFPELSIAVAIWLKSTILSVAGLAEWFSTHFDLTGINYYLLWIAIDISLSWTFTLLDMGSSRVTTPTTNIR